MGDDLNQSLKCLCTTLLMFLFIFLIFSSHTVSSSPSSSTQQIQTQNEPPSRVPIIPTHHHQMFNLKNGDPIFQERFKKKKAKKHRKKTTKKPIRSRPALISVMLPKGLVPPSRSSPCHNQYPTSMSFHCHLGHKN
ncbi:uncharacterized protein LOC129305501 [Prosopis cineraria]|uniref:uncharacterized protein LOC129305501 n=1 Tax=Prosopis cineraria TaxID=364024 RepID=UPI00240F888F|nr:uncharacterized protein LOC129305501 [Prosopis cineraria]